MATIKEVKTQIENTNALGVANLTEKGVEISETATTYEIMQGIADISSGGGTEELEQLIDNSGVLDSTDGTTTEKVEQLIEKANKIDFSAYVTRARQLFYGATTFPTKAVVNLPNATDVYQAFTQWNTEPIPIVEELTVNALNINVANSQTCMGQMFSYNLGVKKVILNMPNESQYMNSAFSSASNLEEVVLGFSTKNIKDYASSFANCKKLKKISGVLDFSSATSVNWMFSSCTDLNEVTFEPNTLSLSISLANSSKLTSVSVQSIIDGLATVEAAQTLTLNKAIVLTDEQKATINAKGWTLAQ